MTGTATYELDDCRTFLTHNMAERVPEVDVVPWWYFHPEDPAAPTLDETEELTAEFARKLVAELGKQDVAHELVVHTGGKNLWRLKEGRVCREVADTPVPIVKRFACVHSGVQCILLEGADFGDHMELYHLRDSGNRLQLPILQRLAANKIVFAAPKHSKTERWKLQVVSGQFRLCAFDIDCGYAGSSRSQAAEAEAMPTNVICGEQAASAFGRQCAAAACVSHRHQLLAGLPGAAAAHNIAGYVTDVPDNESVTQHAISAPPSRQGSDCSTVAVTDEVASANRGPYQDSAESFERQVRKDFAAMSLTKSNALTEELSHHYKALLDEFLAEFNFKLPLQQLKAAQGVAWFVSGKSSPLKRLQGNGREVNGMGLVVAKLPTGSSELCWSAPSYFALAQSESIKPPVKGASEGPARGCVVIIDSIEDMRSFKERGGGLLPSNAWYKELHFEAGQPWVPSTSVSMRGAGVWPLPLANLETYGRGNSLPSIVLGGNTKWPQMYRDALLPLLANAASIDDP